MVLVLKLVMKLLGYENEMLSLVGIVLGHNFDW